MTEEREQTHFQLELNEDDLAAFVEWELAEIDSRIDRNKAEAERHRAEAKRSRALERKLDLESESLKQDWRVNRIVVEQAERREAEVLAQDHMNHVYHFGVQLSHGIVDTEVDEATVNHCIDQLTIWARQSPGCEIEIIINSEGGDVVAGFALFDFLGKLRSQGHKITITALGWCASMAAVILQAADDRVMGKNAVMLLHKGSFQMAGDVDKMKDTMKLMDLFTDRALEIFAEKATASKLTIKKGMDRTDWWLNADQCLKHGFIDRISE